MIDDDPAIVEKICELAEQKLTSSLIGNEVGLAGSTVRAIARRNNIELKPTYQRNPLKRRERSKNEMMPTDVDVATKVRAYAKSLGINNEPKIIKATTEQIEEYFKGIGPIQKPSIINERWL
jgi:hypothetical protein